MVLLDFMRGERRKPHSDLPRLCLIFRIFCYLDAWGDGRGDDKTSFQSGLKACINGTSESTWNIADSPDTFPGLHGVVLNQDNAADPR